MNKLLKKVVEIFPIKRRNRPPTRKEFRMLLIFEWMWMMLWIIIAYLVIHVWHASWNYKWPVYIILLSTFPSYTTYNYEKYVMRWEKMFNPKPGEIRHTNLGVEGMISKRGVVVNKCTPDGGKVRIGNEVWNAITKNGAAIDTGEEIIISEVKDMKLIVEKKE